MAIAYMLGIGKLTRMLRNHGTGKNVLNIVLDQDVTGNVTLTVTLENVSLKPGTGVMDPALPNGGEQMCPVPPGCDSDGNCRSRAAQHLNGNALSYNIQSDRANQPFVNTETITLTIEPIPQI